MTRGRPSVSSSVGVAFWRKLVAVTTDHDTPEQEAKEPEVRVVDKRWWARGEPFDAERHEAVTTAAVTDPAQDGLIVAVVREGYAIGDEVLRPASVVVGQRQTG